jgi:hypothetical protein
MDAGSEVTTCSPAITIATGPAPISETRLVRIGAQRLA